MISIAAVLASVALVALSPTAVPGSPSAEPATVRAAVPAGHVKVNLGVHTLLPIEVQNVDFEVELWGEIPSYDWEQLYGLYDVPLDAPVADWVRSYRANPDREILDRNYEKFERRKFPFQFTVRVHPSNRPLKLRLGFNRVRLDAPSGSSKDFIITNAANVVARTESGEVYPEIEVEPS
ncbi:hypothetical protein [Actinosynnema sp. NPDC020468]|uniref:hypothetical protein n=1 Tax=Actinosynnema sp. NPDC020468 TaxID=3154488 RepID=UPI0034052F63